MICPDLVPDQRGGAADGATLIGRGLRYGRFIATDILVNTTDSLASVAQTNNWSRNPGQKRRKSAGLESSRSRVAVHAAFWLKSEHSGSGSMYRVEYASFPDPALHYEYVQASNTQARLLQAFSACHVDHCIEEGRLCHYCLIPQALFCR